MMGIGVTVRHGIHLFLDTICICNNMLMHVCLLIFINIFHMYINTVCIYILWRYNLCIYKYFSCIDINIYIYVFFYIYNRKGVDKDRFDLALLWLREDLRQTLKGLGIVYENNKHILYNMGKIFSSHNLVLAFWCACVYIYFEVYECVYV
jgi:hypothetical protein